MGLLSSGLTATRFRVIGNELKEGWRDIFRERLNEHAFVEPPMPQKAPVFGWTSIHDLTGVDFADFNEWLLNDWVLFALRTDRRKIPAKRFSAVLKRQCSAWAAEREIGRCPASVRTEIKDRLEDEWIAKVIPTSAHVEIAWALDTNLVYVASHADSVCEQVRKRFHRTFGLRIVPVSPLDWLREDDQVDGLLAAPPVRFVEREG